MSRPDAPTSKASPQLLEILAANVRRLRAESGWSTRAFAEHAGLSLSTLYEIEHGTRTTVRLSTVVTVAKAFGVHVSALLSPNAKPRRPWTGDEPLEIAASALILLRKAKGWTQEELATHAGVARDILAKIERRDRNPTLEVLDRLAAALGVCTADLFASG